MDPLIADREKMEQICGRSLPADLFTFRPWGHRLVVARVAPVGRIPVTRDDGTHVELVIPDQARRIPAVGWVVSVGPQVGEPRADFMGVCPYAGNELLGRKVLFGMYAGSEILVGDEFENQYESLYTLLSDGDVWGTLED